MFNKLFGSFGGKEEKDKIDLSLGYKRTPEFRKYLLAGKYTAFEKEYEQLSWDARTLLNEGIGLDETNAATIQKWVQQAPNSYLACLFAGVSKTRLAWIARTATVAAAVSDDRVERFFYTP